VVDLQQEIRNKGITTFASSRAKTGPALFVTARGALVIKQIPGMRVMQIAGIEKQYI
jgi:hypothetical protein